MPILALALMLTTTGAWHCTFGEFLDTEGNCTLCSARVSDCVACSSDGTLCYDCGPDYFLDENQCVKGESQRLCEAFPFQDACSDCAAESVPSDSICNECVKAADICSACECAKCKILVHYDEQVTLMNKDFPEIRLEGSSFYLVEEDLRCVPDRNLQEVSGPRANNLQLSLRECPQAGGGLLDLELELTTEYSFGQNLTLVVHFVRHLMEIEFFYAGEGPAAYECWKFDQEQQRWVSGCSILAVLQQVQLASEPVLPVKMSSNYSVSLFPVLVLLTYLMFYVILRYLSLNAAKPRNSSFIAQPIKQHSFRQDPSFRQLLDGATALPHDIVIVHSEKPEDSLESLEEVGSPMSFHITYWEVFRYNFRSHHLWFGQFRNYYYQMHRRALLLVLVGLLQTWITVFFVEPRDDWQTLSLKAACLSVGVTLCACALEYFLTMGVVIDQVSFCSLCLLYLLISTAASGILYSSWVSNDIGDWMTLAGLTFAIDFIVTQNAVALVKAAVLSL